MTIRFVHGCNGYIKIFEIISVLIFISYTGGGAAILAVSPFVSFTDLTQYGQSGVLIKHWSLVQIQ